MSAENLNYEEGAEKAKRLARELGHFGLIYRKTLMPDLSPESDSHHSWSLGLIGYELACTFEPELNAYKVYLFCGVHDLPELISGDESTLLMTQEDHQQKAINDAEALEQLGPLIDAPHIYEALLEFEKLDSPEAKFAYWLDKLMTMLSHFFDGGDNLRAMGITTKADIDAWHDTILIKLNTNAPDTPKSAVVIFDLIFNEMRENSGLTD